LAWTKTFTLLAAAILAITLIPVLCYLLLGGRREPDSKRAIRTRQVLRWASALGVAALMSWVALRFDAWFEARVGIRVWYLAAGLFVLSAVVVLRMWSEKLTPIDESPVAKVIVNT